MAFGNTRRYCSSYCQSLNSAKIADVAELYSGAGGNSIQFTLAVLSVTVVEINSSSIDIAKRNASVYGVEKNITLQKSDVIQYLRDRIEKQERCNGLFLDQYTNVHVYDVEPFNHVVYLARKVSSRVEILLSRNVAQGKRMETFWPM